MSAVQAHTASASSTLFDRDGNHLRFHGTPSQHCVPNSLRSLGVSARMQVITRADGRKKKAPEVVLMVSDPPFTFDWRMTAEEARALANNIHRAADTAAEVAEVWAHGGRR